MGEVRVGRGRYRPGHLWSRPFPTTGRSYRDTTKRGDPSSASPDGADARTAVWAGERLDAVSQIAEARGGLDQSRRRILGTVSDQQRGLLDAAARGPGAVPSSRNVHAGLSTECQ